jgi:YVTN family beta-propeller protein
MFRNPIIKKGIDMSYGIRYSTLYIIFSFIILILLSGCGPDEKTPLPPPENITHTISKTTISLSWEAVKGAESYRIYRGASPDGSFEKFGSSTIPFYEDTQATLKNTYFYKITGVDNGVEGKFSAPYQVKYLPGELQIQPIEVDFGNKLESFNLKLKNIGGLALSWKMTTTVNWIILDRKEGNLNPEEEQYVQIKVNRENKPGEYSGIIRATTDTGQGEIKVDVKMEILDKIIPIVDPTQISFTGVGEKRLLTIRNDGTGMFEWAIENIPDWLALDAINGQTDNKSTNQIQLTVNDTGQLKFDKSYTATLKVIITFNGSKFTELTVNVDLFIKTPPPNPPDLFIENTDKNLVLNAPKYSHTIQIYNIGDGILKWRIKADPGISWLQVKPLEGETENGYPDPLTFTVDREQGIPGKTLTASVTIDAENIEDEETITINVPIDSESFKVQPESLILDSNEPKNIEIINNGLETLFWGVESDKWIKLDTEKGETASNNTRNSTSLLKVSTDYNTAKCGSQLGKITLTTRGGSTKTISVQLIKVGHIRGEVRDSISGSIVQDVRISLDGVFQEISKTGSFDLEKCISGSFQIKVEKSGYIFALANGTMDDRGNTSPATFTLWLRPIPRVSRTIKDPGKPFDAPSDMCISGDDTYACISDETGKVSFVNALTDTVTDQFQVGSQPMGIISHPNKHEIYIADADKHQVIVFDTASHKATNYIDVDKYPQQLAITSDGAKLFVTCRDSRSVVIIDTELRQVIGNYSTGREPFGVALSKDERTLYVTNSGDNSVSVIDVKNCTSNLISVANRPQNLAVSDRYVYVSNSLGDRVSVIDQRSQSLKDHIEIGNSVLLSDIVVFPDPKAGDVIYVLDQTNNTVRMIDGITLKAISEQIPVGDTPTAIVLLPDRKGFYIINSGSANISVLKF